MDHQETNPIAENQETPPNKWKQFEQKSARFFKEKTNRYSVIFLALTAYLIIYRGLWRVGFPDFHAAAVGAALVYLVLRLSGSQFQVKRMEKKMTALPFFTFLGLIFLGQLVATFLNTRLPGFFRSIGLDYVTKPPAEQARVLFDDSLALLTSVLFPILLGPVLEELLYRSYACANFSDEGGKVLGILLSSVAFSLSHGRFYLLSNTFISALVYGYVLFEYGVKWTCIFHVINNLGIVGLNMLFCVCFGDGTGNLISDILGIAFALFAVAVIILKRREAGEFISANRAPAGEAKKGFLNVGFPVFAAYCLYTCIHALEQL